MLFIFFILGTLGFLSLLGHFVDQSVGTSIRSFVDEKFGAFPDLLIYCLLECAVIVLIYLDAILSFLSNELSRLFELRIPCLLCTRIDHALVNGSSNLYYNESICDVHKKVVSSLAYCNAHKKLSDSHTMCQGCLLSSAAERDFEFDKYKSIVGIFHKDNVVDCFIEEDPKLRVKASKKEEVTEVVDENNRVLRCSCCGETIKSRSSSSKHMRSLSMNVPIASSPRVPLARIKSGINVDSPRVKFSEVKLVSDPKVELLDDVDTSSNVDINGRIDTKAATMPLLPDAYDPNDEAARTPNFAKGNKFFGAALSDTVQMSPQYGNREVRRPMLEKVDSILESNGAAIDPAAGDIIARMKRKIESNRKSLMVLYMELDEERSASAIAANNAMAMITRLQAEKAAVQMEALQYKRMKEEQAEYEQEARQMMRELLLKREDDVKALEGEIEMYREKYGQMKNVDSEICEVDVEEDYQQDIRSQAMSTFSEKSECGSANGVDQNENDNENSCAEYSGKNPDEDLEGERSHLLELLKNIEGNGSEKVESPVEIEDDQNSKAEVQNKAMFTRELSSIRDRLRVIEADSGFLKHTAMTLEKDGEEGPKLLTEIAQHIRQLRQPDKFPSETTLDE
ncbi:probable myosin-binding protein 5 [Andrographis paniculata]|uniref:probable myosin-binding protein 5 n=1 Tax=Andrographis paniculata TaxID=175694 RepID=UPI0021E71194|nr:probable myosin-binding protein 5 [Andrographis paniculata]